MYHIFPHYLIKGMIFRKKLLNMNCEFWWSHLFLFETFFHSKKNIARYCHKYRRSAPARLLRSWVRIPPGAWIVVCCVLSGRGSCDELITRTEESYRLYCVVVCDLETSWMRRPWPTLGCSGTKNVVVAALLVVVWSVNRPDHDQQRCYHHVPR